MLIALPAFAVDPIFQEELARSAFLKTEPGRKIVRSVIRDARGAPDRLNRQHFNSFLLALDYKQNRELADKLEYHLRIILEPVHELRDANGGAPAKNPVALKKEEDLVLKGADRELNDPDLLDLAGIAREPELESVSFGMRAMVLESMVTSDAPSGPSAPDRTVPGLPEETADLDLYSSNPKVKRALTTQFRIARDFFTLFYKDLRDSRGGVLPTPPGFTPEEAREYHRNFYYNVRRFVNLFDGYNDYARDQFTYELFTNLKRPSYAALNMASKDVLRQYMQGEISIHKLIEAQKKIVETQNLDIPEITWSAQTRILHTIERLTFLCGSVVEGETVPGEIAETTRNLKHDQDKLKEMTADSARLKGELDALSKDRPRNEVKIRRTKQALLSREAQIALWTDRTHRLVDMLAGLYTEVVQLRPRVELFNYFRQGLMSQGMQVETYVGALDMPDAFVVPADVNAHWKKFEDYGLGKLMSPPGDPNYELPDLSSRVIPQLVSAEFEVLFDRFKGGNKDLANEMNRLCTEATGQQIKSRRSMADLALYVEDASAKITFIKKVIGVGTFGSTAAVWFHGTIGHFLGTCHQALEPILKHIGM
jgi:hypothetical protein